MEAFNGEMGSGKISPTFAREYSGNVFDGRSKIGQAGAGVVTGVLPHLRAATGTSHPAVAQDTCQRTGIARNQTSAIAREYSWIRSGRGAWAGSPMWT